MPVIVTSVVAVLLLLYVSRENPLVSLSNEGYSIELLSWSPTGQYLATSATNGMVQIYDVESWQPVTSFSTGKATNTSITWLSGEMIVISQDIYIIQIWDITLPSEIYHLDLRAETSTSLDAALRFAISQLDTNVGILIDDLGIENHFFTWNMKTGELMHHRELSIATWDVQDTNIAFMTTENEIMTFELNTGQTALVAHYFDSQGSQLASMAWSPDSNYIALATRDGRLRIWDAWSGLEEVHIELIDGGIALAGGTEIQWSNDGTRIAVAQRQGNGGILYIVSFASQSILCSTRMSAQALYGPLDWTDDDLYVLGARESTSDGERVVYDVGIWETETCQSERFIPVGFSWTSRWDLFGKFLAVINREQQVEIWSITD